SITISGAAAATTPRRRSPITAGPCFEVVQVDYSAAAVRRNPDLEPQSFTAMHINELETPVPVVDLDVMERNLDRMAAYATEHGIELRPHIKTHKSPRVASEQLRRGAIG